MHSPALVPCISLRSFQADHTDSTQDHRLSRVVLDGICRSNPATGPPLTSSSEQDPGFLETAANTVHWRQQPAPSWDGDPAALLLLLQHATKTSEQRRDPFPAPGPGDKVHLLKGWLSRQGRTTAKNDIVSYLQETTGFQHRETAHQLLENHVQIITGIVEKLGQDIQVLERQIRTRDSATVQTNFAIQSLDHKYIQSLGDLRGRVVRCEVSIAQLSGDIRVIRHEVQKIDKEIYSLHSTFKNHVSSFEKMVMQLLGKLETSSSDQSSNLKTVQRDQHHELQLLDFKLTSVLKDFKDQIENQRKWTEVQLTQSADQAQYQHQLLSVMKERLEAAEKKTEEKLLLLSLQLEQSDNPEEHKRQLKQMKSGEKSLHARITRFERQIWKELEEIQSEYRSGFQSIHESLELLRQIQNTKLKLEKKKTEKDTQRYKARNFQ
ncbi:protein FAM81B [Cyrtonyx montezumae]|uniref:protein FAM81B n=1 Tax=Cyrtonyx montezumae TaxID=9017 RepID=UPI0032DBB48B